jgi:hypothetical protein
VLKDNNTAVGNPEDRITSGWHNHPDEHVLEAQCTVKEEDDRWTQGFMQGVEFERRRLSLSPKRPASSVSGFEFEGDGLGLGLGHDQDQIRPITARMGESQPQGMMTARPNGILKPNLARHPSPKGENRRRSVQWPPTSLLAEYPRIPPPAPSTTSTERSRQRHINEQNLTEVIER